MTQTEGVTNKASNRATAAETRARILNKAIELIATRSIYHVQLQDVARAAGISSALAVRYFKSKEDLFLEAMFVRWESIGVPIMQAWLEANPAPSVRDVALAVIQRDISIRRTTRDFMSMSNWWSLEDEARYERCLEPRRRAFERAITLASGLSPDAPEVVDILALIKHALTDLIREASVRNWSEIEATDHFLKVMAPAFRAIGIKKLD